MDAASGKVICDNIGYSLISVIGGTDHVDGESGDNRLVIDYHAETTAMNGSSDSGSAANTFAAGHGDNTVVTGAGTNKITFGGGHDTVMAGDRTNTIAPGAGEDTVINGVDIDSVDAGAGDDSVTITGGPDRISGGASSDTLIVEFSAANGAVMISARVGTCSAGYARNVSCLGVATLAGIEDSACAADQAMIGWRRVAVMAPSTQVPDRIMLRLGRALT